MDKYPYKVFNPAGEVVLQSIPECRYPRAVELQMLEAGYTIRLSGKRISRAEIKKAQKIGLFYDVADCKTECTS